MRYYRQILGHQPSIEALIEARDSVLKEHPSATSFNLIIEDEYGCPFIGLEYSRDPTEVELAEQELAKEKAIAWEKAAYLRLKEKFGE